MNERKGLTDPSERDACGTGFVAHLRGEKSHAILAQALEAVGNLEHRGAVSPDGRTSDGAGVQTQIPWALIRGSVDTDVADDRLGLMMLFLPPDAVAPCREHAEDAVRRSGLSVVGWREVPFDVDVLGADASKERPEPWQLVVAAGDDVADDEFDRALYLARRRFERAARAAEVGEVSVPSCSRTTVVYKGLVVPGLLTELYPDLANPAYETAIALFHQRYSTNTMPSWRLAQPFRFLAHNGEINTVRGNINRMRAREGVLDGEPWGEAIAELIPIVEPDGSDSAALDNVLEFLVRSGRDPVEAMAMLVPEAHEARPDRTDASSAWAEYRSALMEPWDGPASLVFSDGMLAGAALDRNGLRPLRYWRTDERLIVGSEAGIVDVGDEPVLEKGRLGPGQMLVLDTRTGLLCRDDDVKDRLASRHDWVSWARDHVRRVGSVDEADVPELFDDDLVRIQKSYGYGREHLERVLAPMSIDAKIPVGSMGDDTPLAVLSDTPQRFFRFFKQSFAQVTNPAIDPLRERLVMSLSTRIGLGGDLLDTEPVADLIEFDSPVVSAGHLAWLERETRSQRIDTTFPIADGPDGLEAALDRICEEAATAVGDGARILILSDRSVDEHRARIPSLLATAAVHHHLIRERLRMGAAIVCDAGDVIEDHDFACLLGFGAMLVHPWLAYESVAALARKDSETEPSRAVHNYRRAVEKGLLKIMAKLGIADVNSYRGAQTFEALGIDYDVVERYFTGCRSRIGGATLHDIAADVFSFHANGWGEDDMLRELGIYRFRRHGEYHAFNPGVFKWLHKAVRNQDSEAYRKYADAVDNRPPVTLRDLLEFDADREAIPLDEVEPAEAIARRFCTQAMSFGSLSRETHELLAVAMNRLGGRSNSGEGGEEPVRFRPYEGDAPERSVAAWHPSAGDWGNSAIKQIASGRFGVTPDYLVSARELEIKMAQGSKPGEGGHIPGFKVTEDIARTRRSQPGMTLISPPPHHDIYSIEDLAQLIYDLKRVNGEATVAVKLVSVVGVGTIATGVAKGYADAIQISGHDGGTGASPLSSIKHAGLPWELGLGEVQQRLVENDLRGRVRLRVDGGLKTGRDVVVAAMLGAEEFGFGTTALVAAGCVMARQCHSNTCPVGIATQREDLRARFKGEPSHVVSFMLFVAEHVRHVLSELGVRTLDEIIGRVDLLRPRTDLPARAQRVDLSRLLWEPDRTGTRAKRHVQPRNDRPEADPPLDQRIFEEAVAAWDTQGRFEFSITNADRSVGARLAGEIARRQSSPEGGLFDLRFDGEAGQSFGAFCNHGMRLTLVGEAQDYVAKGMAGGEVVITPVDRSRTGDVIMGNTVAYGATGGTLFAAGHAGERLAVRNSGATIVVEGCGDHGCEYMTGGTVVVLGRTGLNFGAGMSGGEAFVLDEDGGFRSRLNTGMADCGPMDDDERQRLRALVQRYADATQSERAHAILADWDSWVGQFCRVRPHERSAPVRTSNTA